MNCGHRTDAARYFDGELSDSERKDFEAHVEGCAECRAMLARYERLSACLKETGPDAKPQIPAARILAAARAPERLKARRLRSLAWKAAPFAAAVLLAAGLIGAIKAIEANRKTNAALASRHIADGDDFTGTLQDIQANIGRLKRAIDVHATTVAFGGPGIGLDVPPTREELDMILSSDILAEPDMEMMNPFSPIFNE